MYTEFHQYAVEDAAAGYRYVILHTCVFCYFIHLFIGMLCSPGYRCVMLHLCTSMSCYVIHLYTGHECYALLNS